MLAPWLAVAWFAVTAGAPAAQASVGSARASAMSPMASPPPQTAASPAHASPASPTRDSASPAHASPVSPTRDNASPADGSRADASPSGAPPAGAPSPAGRRLLDRVVAVVDRQPLLLSQLELEARVALIQRGGVEASSAPLAEADLAAALEYAIGQRLAFTEAERLEVFPIDESEVASAASSFIHRFASERDYLRFLVQQSATPEQLAAILRRDLRAARFVESKIKRSGRVGEEEAQRFYREHAAEYGGRSWSDVREAIRSHLLRERYRALAQELLEQLRARADVRLLVRFGPGLPGRTPLDGTGVAPEGTP